MGRILVPTDGSECSAAAMAKARELAGFYGSGIVLINVYDMPYLNSYFDFQHHERELNVHEQLKRDSEKILEKGKELFGDMGDRIETLSVEGNPAEKIIEYVESNDDIELVVMGSHGMGGFRRFFLGSVTHKVAVSINKPILII